MQIRILTVGKTKTQHWQVAESEYIRRIKKYSDVQQVVVKDATREAMSNPELAKEIEGKNLLAKISDDEYLVALDSRGQQMTSEAFAEFFEKRALRGTNKFSFVLGGPLGLSQVILQRADVLLSLSKMTLPHELAKVVLLEQVYRAFSILRHEKYHK
ncbi:MAG TPA: 23S rRNA (pseudouridine(1915)-N(3))-methyltransferase RlmH [bacterium]